MVKRFGKNLILLEKLASGGMAEVYRAQQIGHGGFQKTVALKRILPQYASKEDFNRMFREEANLSAVLQHPNIVQIFSNGEQDSYLYLVMEFVDGKNVRQLLAACDKAKIRIPIDVTCYIVSEAAKGLSCAHDAIDEIKQRPLNIIHRDISPQNLMLSYNGLLKIVDFGIAKAANQSEETRAGVLKGKFGYMSPEQAQGMTLDSRSDVFSLGIVLFELLTQRRLFTTKDDMKTLKLVQQCRVPRPSKYNPSIESALDSIVLKALSKDRSERYQNADDFSYELQNYMTQKYGGFKIKKVSSMLKKIFADKIEKEKIKRDKVNAELAKFDFETEEEVEVKAKSKKAKLDKDDLNEQDYDDFLDSINKNQRGKVDMYEDDASQNKLVENSNLKVGKEQNISTGQFKEKSKSTAEDVNFKAGKEEGSVVTSVSGINELQSKSIDLNNQQKEKSLSVNAAYDLGDDIFENEKTGNEFVQTSRIRAVPTYQTFHEESSAGRSWGRLIVLLLLAGGAYFLVTMSEQSRDKLVCGVKEKIGFPVCGAVDIDRNKPPKIVVENNTAVPERNPAAIEYPWKEKTKLPKGILNLSSVPDANEIYINGRQLLDPVTREPAGTPLKEYTMKPGAYDIELRSTVFGLSTKKRIVIKSDGKEDHLEIILTKPE